ncbi:MAG TPA: alpha/beta hydrolase [Mycobacteriales bacterium]|jgi:acetyl esterase/lipase
MTRRGRPVLTERYGADRAQVGDLWLPAGAGPHPVVVVLHGGFWRAAYDRGLGAPLARDLARHGFAAWNLEYRRVGGGGGWPTTLADVGAGIDQLAALAASQPLDLGQVSAVGHSAGGQLAVWSAARHTLGAGLPGARPRVRLVGAVAQAGVLDLEDAAWDRLGAGAVEDLLGGPPDVVPDRYACASPIRRLPIGVPVLCVHGRADDTVPVGQSERYAHAAALAGDSCDLRLVGGGHFSLLEPDSSGWAAVLTQLEAWAHR